MDGGRGLVAETDSFSEISVFLSRKIKSISLLGTNGKSLSNELVGRTTLLSSRDAEKMRGRDAKRKLLLLCILVTLYEPHHKLR